MSRRRTCSRIATILLDGQWHIAHQKLTDALAKLEAIK